MSTQRLSERVSLGGPPWRGAKAQAANTVRIALLCDFSGTYRDVTGPTGLACIRQAAAEFGNQESRGPFDYKSRCRPPLARRPSARWARAAAPWCGPEAGRGGEAAPAAWASFP